MASAITGYNNLLSLYPSIKNGYIDYNKNNNPDQDELIKAPSEQNVLANIVQHDKELTATQKLGIVGCYFQSLQFARYLVLEKKLSLNFIFKNIANLVFCEKYVGSNVEDLDSLALSSPAEFTNFRMYCENNSDWLDNPDFVNVKEFEYSAGELKYFFYKDKLSSKNLKELAEFLPAGPARMAFYTNYYRQKDEYHETFAFQNFFNKIKKRYSGKVYEQFPDILYRIARDYTTPPEKYILSYADRVGNDEQLLYFLWKARELGIPEADVLNQQEKYRPFFSDEFIYELDPTNNTSSRFNEVISAEARKNILAVYKNNLIKEDYTNTEFILSNDSAGFSDEFLETIAKDKGFDEAAVKEFFSYSTIKDLMLTDVSAEGKAYIYEGKEYRKKYQINTELLSALRIALANRLDLAKIDKLIRTMQADYFKHFTAENIGPELNSLLTICPKINLDKYLEYFKALSNGNLFSKLRTPYELMTACPDTESLKTYLKVLWKVRVYYGIGIDLSRFSPQTIYHLYNNIDAPLAVTDKVVLFIYGKQDKNKAFANHLDLCYPDQFINHGYRVLVYEVDAAEQFKKLTHQEKFKGKIDTLIVACHGSAKSMSLGFSQGITEINTDIFSAELFDRESGIPLTVLWSCGTADPKATSNNISEKIFDVVKTKLYASKDSANELYLGFVKNVLHNIYLQSARSPWPYNTEEDKKNAQNNTIIYEQP